MLVMTRWNTKDLTGMLLKAQKEVKSDQWDIVEFPAIMPSGKPVWPEYWKLDELEGVKASLSVQKWNAQWMQNPTSEEGAIIKREWWKNWDKDYIPTLEHVIQSYDTAFMKKETADYSAISSIFVGIACFVQAGFFDFAGNALYPKAPINSLNLFKTIGSWVSILTAI